MQSQLSAIGLEAQITVPRSWLRVDITMPEPVVLTRSLLALVWSLLTLVEQGPVAKKLEKTHSAYAPLAYAIEQWMDVQRKLVNPEKIIFFRREDDIILTIFF